MTTDNAKATRGTKARAIGALLGLAVGDAVGTTLEFKPPGTFEPITDMVGGGPFGHSHQHQQSQDLAPR